MQNSGFATFLQEDDKIEVERSVIRIAQITMYLESDKQLLDLGMKIQSVVNQIDRENRVIVGVPESDKV